MGLDLFLLEKMIKFQLLEAQTKVAKAELSKFTEKSMLSILINWQKIKPMEHHIKFLFILQMLSSLNLNKKKIEQAKFQKFLLVSLRDQAKQIKKLEKYNDGINIQTYLNQIRQSFIFCQELIQFLRLLNIYFFKVFGSRGFIIYISIDHTHKSCSIYFYYIYSIEILEVLVYGQNNYQFPSKVNIFYFTSLFDRTNCRLCLKIYLLFEVQGYSNFQGYKSIFIYIRIIWFQKIIFQSYAIFQKLLIVMRYSLQIVYTNTILINNIIKQQFRVSIERKV